MYFTESELNRVADALYERIHRRLVAVGQGGVPPGGGNGKPAKNPPPNIPKRLFTVEEAARYLGRTKSAIEHMIHRGELASCLVRKDRRVFIDRISLDKWIEASRR
jgi:excisionase family DNA binding protein